jgi:hypothetical protein
VSHPETVGEHDDLSYARDEFLGDRYASQ